ncbi:MAG: toxic anion resistance protein [Clostridia bacterium]|nr:toxic anion resistance protein [Clostridia bacterium]
MENQVPELKLTLDPFGEKETRTDTKEAEEIAIEKMDEAALSNLTPEEKEMVHDFASKIDVTDQATILQYGAGTQQKIADFSDSALKSVRTQDLGEAGDMIAALVGELKAFNDETDEKGLSGIFHRGKKKVTVLKAKYDKAEVSVNNIVNVLEGHQVTLLKDIAVLDKLYDTNLVYFKELSMYILAGKEKLREERATTLISLRKRAEESGLPEDAQRANDFAASCDRFETKIYDLELTRMASIQMAPLFGFWHRQVSMTQFVTVEPFLSWSAPYCHAWACRIVTPESTAPAKNAPIRTVSIPLVAKPCAVRKGFTPSPTSVTTVPMMSMARSTLL